MCLEDISQKHRLHIDVGTCAIEEVVTSEYRHMYVHNCVPSTYDMYVYMYVRMCVKHTHINATLDMLSPKYCPLVHVLNSPRIVIPI